MIYFITDGDYIKVGYAKDPSERLKTLQTGNPKKLELIHSMPGTLQEGQALHKELESYHVQGEWFKPNNKISELIRNTTEASEQAVVQYGAAKPISVELAKSDVENENENRNKSIAAWQYQLMEEQGTLGLLSKVKLSPDQVQAVIELPIYGQAPAQTVAAINSIRQQQRQGNFMQPAIFAKAILQDSVIYSNLQQRVKALIGAGVELLPADESDKAREIQEDVEKKFSVMCPAPEMEDMLMDALVLGNSISQIMWDRTTKSWTPTLRSFDVRYLWFNFATRQYALTTESTGQVDILHESIQWDIFTPFSNHYPWLKALILPLAMLYLIRNWNEQWWSSHQEKNGSGLLVAIASAEATPAEERLFVQQLFNRQNNSVVRARQGEDGNKFDVKFVQPGSDLYEGFKEILDYIDRRIAMLVLGQDKATMSKAGMQIGGGDAGESIKLELTRSDANALGENLREKILKNYVRFNYGEEFVELTPYIQWDIEPAEDLKVRADELKSASEAISNFMNMPDIAEMIDFRALLEQFNLPLNELVKAPKDIPNVQQSVLEPADDLNEDVN